MNWTIEQLAEACDLRFRTISEKADLLEPYHFRANGYEFRVATELDTDGASIPRSLLGVVGDRYDRLNIFPAIIHDSCYTSDLWASSSIYGWMPVYLAAADADGLFMAARTSLGGSLMKTWFMWAAIRYNSELARRYPSFEDFKKKHKNGLKFEDFCRISPALG